MGSISVYLVRHGQTADNLQSLIQGHLDTPLDEVGREQAAALAEELKDIRFDLAFSSDLKRASDTARVVLHYHPELFLHESPELRGKYMGVLQGQPIPADMVQASDDGFFDHESVETNEAFTTRILKFWNDIVIPEAKKALETHPDRDTFVLVASHGACTGTLIRSLIAKKDIAAIEATSDASPNASITLVKVHSDNAVTLEKFGGVAYPSRQILGEEPVTNIP